MAYDEGEGVPQDHQQAVAWYRKAAAQTMCAHSSTWRSYDDGEGVAQDKKQAVHWYTKAAEQGDADAQQTCPSCTHRGEGVACDAAKSHATGRARRCESLAWDGDGCVVSQNR